MGVARCKTVSATLCRLNRSPVHRVEVANRHGDERRLLEASMSDGVVHAESEGPHLARLMKRTFRDAMQWTFAGALSL